MVNEVTGPPGPPVLVPQRRQAKGFGAAVGRGLAAGTGGLVGLTSKIFGQMQKRGGAAVADFQARPEHSRWRAYALGSYGVIVAATLVAQLYSSNPLDAYVRLQLVDLPNTTMIFVRNDSRREWKHVRLTLNGIYTFETLELKAGGNILVPITRFTVLDSASGKTSSASKAIVPKQLAIDCDRGHLDVELAP
jgi:hypothetical protein